MRKGFSEDYLNLDFPLGISQHRICSEIVGVGVGGGFSGSHVPSKGTVSPLSISLFLPSTHSKPISFSVLLCLLCFLARQLSWEQHGNSSMGKYLTDVTGSEETEAQEKMATPMREYSNTVGLSF